MGTEILDICSLKSLYPSLKSVIPTSTIKIRVFVYHSTRSTNLIVCYHPYRMPWRHSSYSSSAMPLNAVVTVTPDSFFVPVSSLVVNRLLALSLELRRRAFIATVSESAATWSSHLRLTYSCIIQQFLLRGQYTGQTFRHVLDLLVGGSKHDRQTDSFACHISCR